MFLASRSITSIRRSGVAFHRVPAASVSQPLVVAAGESWQQPQQQTKRTMGTTIVEGVEFDTIAREWRCKWSAENDKKSLSDLQKVLDDTRANISGIEGVKSVQRVVCGGCLDFKVVIALEDGKFGDWQESNFAPEESFLDKIKKIDGVSAVETQTYTLMPVEL